MTYRASDRLKVLSDHLKLENETQSKVDKDGKPKVPNLRIIQDDVWAMVGGDEFLDQKGIDLRKKMRSFMESI